MSSSVAVPACRCFSASPLPPSGRLSKYDFVNGQALVNSVAQAIICSPDPRAPGLFVRVLRRPCELLRLSKLFPERFHESFDFRVDHF